MRPKEEIHTDVFNMLRRHDATVKDPSSLEPLKSPNERPMKDYIYVLEVVKDKYVLKGQKVVFPLADDPEINTNFTKAAKSMIFICQEYYATKMANTLCPHFLRVFDIDSKAVVKDGVMNVYTEMTLEMGGKPLNDKSVSKSILDVYNFMRQTAVAIDALHSAGMSHLDLKPGNILYNVEKDFVKVIDMGTCNVSTSESVMDRSTMLLHGQVRGITYDFGTPEMLRQAVNRWDVAMHPSGISKQDVYLYAMTFFSILVGWDLRQFNEARELRSGDQEQHDKFLKIMKDSVENVPCSSKDEPIKEFMLGQFEKCLRFEPGERTSFAHILEMMQEFEQKNVRVSEKLQYVKDYNNRKPPLLARLCHPFNTDPREQLSNELNEKQELIKKNNILIDKLAKDNRDLSLEVAKLREELDAADKRHRIAAEPTRSDVAKLLDQKFIAFQLELDRLRPEFQCTDCATTTKGVVKLSCGHSLCFPCAARQLYPKCNVLAPDTALRCRKCRSKVGTALWGYRF